jgi:hypothetical protein
MGVETAGRGKAKAEEAGEAAEQGAEKAAGSPALEWAARAGWIVKGLLYLTMGTLAMGLALGLSGATDQRGILRMLTSMFGDPWGTVLVIAIAAALAGHALWNFFCAVFDPFRGPEAHGGWGRRLAFAARGVGYAALLLFCVQLASGRPGSDSDSTVPKATAAALDHPFGQVLIVIAGLVAIGAGVGVVVQGFRSSYKKDLREEQMSEKERAVAKTLGRLGACAYGLVCVVIGWFVLQAAVFHDPKQAKGIVGAFNALAQQPAGRLLLALIALGFLGLGLYSLAASRWMRMPGARGGGRSAQSREA